MQGGRFDMARVLAGVLYRERNCAAAGWLHAKSGWLRPWKSVQTVAGRCAHFNALVVGLVTVGEALEARARREKVLLATAGSWKSRTAVGN
jgi:hypothetical protein